MDSMNSITIPNEFLFTHALKYLQQGRSIIIAVKGKSMMPFLRDGNRVLLKPVGENAVSKGMIVLARYKEKMLLHRIVRLDCTSVWLAGDGNLVLGERVLYSDVVAVAEYLYRANRRVNLNRRWKRILGLIWYKARPLRRIVGKILKR